MYAFVRRPHALRAWGWLLVIWIVALTAHAVAESVAPAGRRRPYRPSAAAQAARRAAALRQAEQQTAAQVKAAEAALKQIAAYGAGVERRVEAAQQQLSAAAAAAQQTKDAIDLVEKQLRAIEEQLEEQQPEESEFGVLAKRWEAASKSLRHEQDRVLNSPEYRLAHEAALVASDRVLRLSQVRSDALAHDVGYQRAKAEFEQIDLAVDTARLSLYTSDETWKRASEDLRAARRELANALAAITGGGLHRAVANADLKNAQQTAAVVSAALQSSQSRLKSIQSRLGKKPSSSSSSNNN